MTVVSGGALLIIPAKKERVTVSQTATVSTLAGPSVAMTCVSTPNTSPHLSIQTTLPGLDSLALTTAATESATKTITDAEMEWLDAESTLTVMMVTTARLTWTNLPAMSLMNVRSPTPSSMEQSIVEMRPHAVIQLEASLAPAKQDSLLTFLGLAAET